MRLISIIFFSLLFSCNSSVEETEKPILDPSLENPWTYINRISDTLSETEFSLFKTKVENLKILSKFNVDDLHFRYKIEENKYLLVTANSIFKPTDRCYVMGMPLVIHFNDDGSYMLPHENLIIQKENLDTFSIIYENSIKESDFESIDTYGSYFVINCKSNTNKKRITDLIEVLADGYWKFLNNKKNNFNTLNENKKNELLRMYPFAMLYEFGWLPRDTNETNN